MKRRDFIKSTGTIVAASPFMNFGAGIKNNKKMLVLGFDGMDPMIAYDMIQRGELPNLKRLAQSGVFSMMRTTIPPQSPVAWGSFITGADPGKYGLFDFVHRDPETYFPITSGAETIPASLNIKIGKYKIPLKPGKIVPKREGKAFWDYLEEKDVEATIFKIPSNYPPSKSKQRTIAGMGTPDIHGTYGISTLYTSDEEEAMKDITPNNLFYAYLNEENVLEDGEILGPVNDLVENGEKTKVSFKVFVDKENKTARIDVDGKEILIAEKEYSDWVEIDFPLIKGVSSITGMVKFYMMDIEKSFRLYISPIHISPKTPAVEISTPPEYAEELAKKVGLFHTIGLPADTKALSQETFGVEEFLTQSNSVFDESKKLFGYEYEKFLNKKNGFLFFYFGSLDQGQHMLWALTDKDHPYYHPEEAKRFGYMKEELYRMHDRILGDVLNTMPKDMGLIVLSDHGFGTFRRKVNLNTFLFNEGYLKFGVNEIDTEISLFDDYSEYDWGNTKAYAVGLNGLYLNMKGRESQGIVTKGERRKLLEELQGKIQQIRDPENGRQVISEAFITEDHFSPDFLIRSPDIILGFNRGYRSSDSSALGGATREMVTNNMNWWAGDHCINPRHVPASFFSNFPINKKIPSIKDMAPTILNYFGINETPTMNGDSLI